MYKKVNHIFVYEKSKKEIYKAFPFKYIKKNKIIKNKFNKIMQFLHTECAMEHSWKKLKSPK